MGVNDTANLDRATVRDFGPRMTAFRSDGRRRSGVVAAVPRVHGYFPWASLPDHAVAFDASCGSGRWAALVAPRVGHLNCVDASAEALAVGRNKLAAETNVSFHETCHAARRRQHGFRLQLPTRSPVLSLASGS
jgi:hypothetical protein